MAKESGAHPQFWRRPKRSEPAGNPVLQGAPVSAREWNLFEKGFDKPVANTRVVKCHCVEQAHFTKKINVGF